MSAMGEHARAHRLTDAQIFESDCTAQWISTELQQRQVRKIQYKSWECRLVGFRNYWEIQFLVLVQPLPSSSACDSAPHYAFGRPRHLPAVVACDGTRLWWDGALSAERSKYTRINVCDNGCRSDSVRIGAIGGGGNTNVWKCE